MLKLFSKIVIIITTLSSVINGTTENKLPNNHHLNDNVVNGFFVIDENDGSNELPPASSKKDGSISGINNPIKLIPINTIDSHNSKQVNNTPKKLVFIDENIRTTSSFPINRLTRISDHRKRIKRHNLDRENVCDHQCKCVQENNFLTVECDFGNEQNILGQTKFIPSTASKLTIRLAPRAYLRIDEHFFHNNNINKILITGRSTEEYVEIGPRAFVGNDANFPEIEIVNCRTVGLKSHAFYGTLYGEFTLNISNCVDLVIEAAAFFKTTFHAHFENITYLQPNEKSFTNSKAKLLIVNSIIDQLHRLDASIRELKFINSTIDTIRQGAFDVISIDSIVFEDSRIRTIESGATTEKLYSNLLSITGCDIETIKQHAIDGSGITNVTIANNNINNIEENAIHLTSINILIANNTIKSVEHHWFQVKDWSNVTINQNSFGEFNQMNINKTANPAQCIFSNNFITKPSKGSLTFTNPHCTVIEVSFFHICDCRLEWLTQLSRKDLRNESFCQVDQTFNNCYNKTLINVERYDKEICRESNAVLDCMKNQSMGKEIKGTFIHPEEITTSSGTIVLITLIVCAVMALIGVLLLTIFGLNKFFKKNNDRDCYQTQHITTNLPEKESPNPVVPHQTAIEPKFTNHDRVIMKKTLNKLRDEYPKEKYNQMANLTHILITDNLSDADVVLTIGEILKILASCNNSGDDFVAFTSILYKQLEHKDTNQNEPEYAELNIVDGNEERNILNNEGNRIFGEPSSQHQPLLLNEYASPADTSENHYSEPIPSNGIASEKSRQTINPYAIGKTCLDEPPTYEDSLAPQNNYNQPIDLNMPSTSSAGLYNPSIAKHYAASDVQFINPIPSTSKYVHNPLSNLNSRSPNPNNSSNTNTNNMMPKYTIPTKHSKFRGDSSSSPPDSLSSQDTNTHSDHSGGSDVTLELDKDIQYADD